MNNTTTTTKFSLAYRIGAWWGRRREPGRREALRRRCPPATVAAAQIPPAVRIAWAHHAPDEFPGLATDDGAWLRCSLGLAQFFEGCRLQKDQGPCALPSKAADSVWHVWLKLDPAGLASWQECYFGRAVDHRENAELGVPPEEALARTWAGACRSEGLELLGPRLPPAFRPRRPVAPAHGLGLRLSAGHAGPPPDRRLRPARRERRHARLHRWRQPGHAGPDDQSELATAMRRRQGSDSGSSCGSSWSYDSGGGSCDAGSDGGDCSDGGGSSCGSSCGGGGD